MTMSNMRHASGTWYIDHSNTLEGIARQVVQIPGDGSVIVQGYNVATHARLIAAAPDLLEACEMALLNGYRVVNPDDGDRLIGDRLRAALAKAEGK